MSIWRVVLGGLSLVLAGCGLATETADVGKDSARAVTGGGEAASFSATPVEHRESGTQVTVTLRLAKGTVTPGEELELAVEMKVAPLWEIHALDAEPAESATKLEIITPPGIRVDGAWRVPKVTRSMSDSGQPVYLGKATFERNLVIDSAVTAGTHEIACRVGYQACNKRQCLKPEELVLRVPLVVEQ